MTKGTNDVKEFVDTLTKNGVSKKIAKQTAELLEAGFRDKFSFSEGEYKDTLAAITAEVKDLSKDERKTFCQSLSGNTLYRGGKDIKTLVEKANKAANTDIDLDRGKTKAQHNQDFEKEKGYERGKWAKEAKEDRKSVYDLLTENGIDKKTAKEFVGKLTGDAAKTLKDSIDIGGKTDNEIAYNRTNKINYKESLKDLVESNKKSSGITKKDIEQTRYTLTNNEHNTAGAAYISGMSVEEFRQHQKQDLHKTPKPQQHDYVQEDYVKNDKVYDKGKELIARALPKDFPNRDTIIDRYATRFDQMYQGHEDKFMEYSSPFKNQLESEARNFANSLVKQIGEYKSETTLGQEVPRQTIEPLQKDRLEQSVSKGLNAMENTKKTMDVMDELSGSLSKSGLKHNKSSSISSKPPKVQTSRGGTIEH